MKQLSRWIAAKAQMAPDWLVGGLGGAVMTLVGAAGVLGWLAGNAARPVNPVFVLACWLMLLFGPLAVAGGIFVKREKRDRKKKRRKIGKK